MNTLYNLFPLEQKQILHIEELLSTLSVKEKIGQVIFSGLTGTYMSSDSNTLTKISNLVEKGIGGLVFFKGELKQYHSLINQFQKISKIPLLFSADFERGLAMRIAGMVSFPHNMAVAQTGDIRLAERLGSLVSREMRHLGIQMNFAPVVDLAGVAENPVINIRAFSDDKQKVTEFANAFIYGSKQHRVITVLKHFPGHGYTKEDSHNVLPVVDKTKAELFDSDLVPFISCIKAGAQCIMSAHLEVPEFEPEKGLPATLSKNILTALLREELGFEGLIVSDAMNMNGVTNYYSAREAAVKAFLAGNDALLLPPDDDIYFDALEEAVTEGVITEERLNTSVRRIFAAKMWSGLFSGEAETKEIDVIAGREAAELAAEIASKSVTMFSGVDIIPQEIKPGTVCITVSDKLPGETESYFAETFSQIHPETEKIYISPFTTNEMLNKIAACIMTGSLVLIPIFYRARSYQGAIQLSDELLGFFSELRRKDIHCIYLFFGNPYLSGQLEKTDNIILAYSDVPASQKAALQKITGINI